MLLKIPELPMFVPPFKNNMQLFKINGNIALQSKYLFWEIDFQPDLALELKILYYKKIKFAILESSVVQN